MKTKLPWRQELSQKGQILSKNFVTEKLATFKNHARLPV